MQGDWTEMDKSTALLLVVILSEILAVVLIWGIWQRQDYRFMKIMMSVVALIPVVGTLGILWVHGFPSVKNRALQNRGPGYIPTTEVFDRWRHVFDEKDERKRRQAAAELLEEHRDD